jgi:uncharacterized protein (TIGR00255 family)
MTGFGEAERETPAGTVRVQVRTVNHRHFHTHFRLPEAFESWEPEVTSLLRARIARGHVRYRLELDPATSAAPAPVVVHERVRAYLAALEELRATHGLPGEVRLETILRFGDVLRTSTAEGAALELADVAAATRSALEDLVETREAEGRALEADLLTSLSAVESALDIVARQAPERLRRERDRLRAAVQELSAGVDVDEGRLAREIAYLAERWDINEEIVRLRAHLTRFREALSGEVEEPVGKRLSFWVQEMLREANTIGSKANDSAILEQVVEMKTAIEKLREQVENVE